MRWFLYSLLQEVRLSAPPPHFELKVKMSVIHCAPIVLNCAAIFFNCAGPFFQLSRKWFSELSPPPPHCVFQIQNNGNQLCSNCAQLCWNFSPLTGPIVQLQRGGVGSQNSASQPPIAVSWGNHLRSNLTELYFLSFWKLWPRPERYESGFPRK